MPEDSWRLLHRTERPEIASSAHDRCRAFVMSLTASWSTSTSATRTATRWLESSPAPRSPGLSAGRYPQMARATSGGPHPSHSRRTTRRGRLGGLRRRRAIRRRIYVTARSIAADIRSNNDNLAGYSGYRDAKRQLHANVDRLQTRGWNLLAKSLPEHTECIYHGPPMTRPSRVAGSVNSCRTRHRTRTCSTGPCVDGRRKRSRISAGSRHDGSGQQTSWGSAFLTRPPDAW
jgi:hypothetical protein